jgi:Putative zinc-finger
VSQFPHDEFLALCALSTSGELTREERDRLQEHLPGCHTCREAMKQYDAVANSVVPVLSPDPESLEPHPSWSQERAEAVLFQRLMREEERSRDREGRSG